MTKLLNEQFGKEITIKLNAVIQKLNKVEKRVQQLEEIKRGKE